MRIWATTLVVMASGCFQPVADGVLPVAVDAGRVVDAGRPPYDAGRPPVRVDPCAWDGGGEGLCQVDTVGVFDGVSCRGVCATGRSAGEPGVFALGQCQRFCVPQPSCDWDGAGEVVDAGAETAWAFDGPTCVPVRGVAPGRPGVFATHDECELFCPCRPGKFNFHAFPFCNAQFYVEPGTVPPVPSWYDVERDAYWQVKDTFRHTRGSLAELCRATLAPNVVAVECLGGE